MPCAHRVVSAKYDLLSECLHAILEVPGCKQHISPHHLVLLFLHMVLEVLFPGYFNSFLTDLHFNPRLLLAQLVDIIENLAVQFLQLRGEVGAPAHVTRSEGEEDLKAKNENIIMSRI